MKLAVGLILFQAFTLVAGAAQVRVDPRDPKAFQTLREASATLKPGDTLWLAPGSGPYREELSIRVSGLDGFPIIVEGNGNEITGFEPVIFRNGVANITVEYPFVLRHQGRRVPEDADGVFVSGISYDGATKRLILLEETSPEGWEISSRKFAVRVQDVSHHVYRDLVASGSLNDGFNLHGAGENLLFEKISGCQNLDEGYSAHDTIHSEVREGRFFENDNGMLSGQKTVTRMSKVDLWDNLGIGLGFNGEAVVEARDTRIWNNGMTQLLLRTGVTAAFTNVRVYTNLSAKRAWLTYKESARFAKPVTTDRAPGVAWPAQPPSIENQTAPERNEAPPSLLPSAS